jgi:hypothetical protein
MIDAGLVIGPTMVYTSGRVAGVMDAVGHH